MNWFLPLVPLLIAGSALAAETVALLPAFDPVGPPDNELLQLTNKLREELSDRGATIQTPAETRARLQATPATEAELRRRFDLGRKLVDTGAFEAAARVLEDLVVAIENLEPPADDIYQLWAGARFWQAMAEAGGRSDREPPSDKMLSAIESVLLVEPVDGSFIDPFRERAPPRWREGFDAALRERRRKPLFRITVTSPVPASSVYINTKPFGKAPINTLLPAGRYLIRGLAKGHASLPAVFVLGADRSIRLDFAAPEIIRTQPALALAVARPAMDTTLLAVGSQLGVDRLIVTFSEAKQNRLIASITDLRSGALVREASIALNASALVGPLAEFLLTGKTADRLSVSFPRPGTSAGAKPDFSDRGSTKGDGKPEDTSAVAKLHYNRARTLFGEGRFEAAIMEFEAAVDAKSHPFTFYNIAECYERLGNGRERLRNLREYLRLLPTAEDRPAVLQMMTDLEATLRRPSGQTIQITTEPDHAEVWIDSEVRGWTPFRASLYQGDYELKVVKPGYRPVAQRVKLVPQAPLQLGLRLTAE